MPANRKMYSFYITSPLAEGLKVVKRTEGISESEQIRRALEEWLRKRGIELAEPPKRKRK
jgi:Arc/MetJ-type ribon-helix-helix transcriptional regulator